MNWLIDIARKTQDTPVASSMSPRLHRKPRRYSAAEPDQLLVKIDLLTARNDALPEVANIEATRQENQLSEDEGNILKILGREDEASAYQIAAVFRFSLARAQHHLNRLLECQYLVRNKYLGRQAYLLDQRGRDYLATIRPDHGSAV